MNLLSRREFVATGGSLLSSVALAQGLPYGKLTVGEVIQWIKKQVAIPLREKPLITC
jgi:hypothetical protein